jgi:hydrogenase maturation protease
MNPALVDAIANAVLYEGYILYPYRPSVKNRHRWTIGGLYPRSYCLAQGGHDAWTLRTECLVQGDHRTTIEVQIRFLHLLVRFVGQLAHPVTELPSGAEPAYRVVESLQVGDQQFFTWQEAAERTIRLDDLVLDDLSDQTRLQGFAFPPHRAWEPLRDSREMIVGVLVREQHAVEGSLEVSAERVEDGLFKVSARIVNLTPLEDAGGKSRDEALLRSLVSAHTILGVRGGEFVSLLDPPDRWREIAAGCRNEGTWPVLVGAAGQRDTMLSSPIILYDYPQIAPESAGDLFDATEIDEILSLHILTLTDDEKQAMAAVDERARALLQRTEALAPDQLLGLHGTVRGLRALPAEDDHE